MTAPAIASCTGRSVSAYRHGSDDLAVLSLALWETAARVANAHPLRPRDVRILADGRYAIDNQRVMLHFVHEKAGASARSVEPAPALADSGDVLELAWEAAEGIGYDLPETLEGADLLIASIDKISQGDQVEARQMVPLFRRIARLAEQRIG